MLRKESKKAKPRGISIPPIAWITSSIHGGTRETSNSKLQQNTETLPYNKY